MKINIFEQEIELRDYHCSLNSQCPLKADNYINLYVRIENTCNAKCKFCNFKGENKEFDFYKFYYIINELNKIVRINKVSFTGGEPTKNLNDLKKCLKITKELNKNIFTVINTNGYKLNELLSNINHNLIDSVSLSRHHYDDNINDSIFGEKMLSYSEIENLNQSFNNKIHLSCNLIKGFIDNKEEIFRYLNKASERGIKDIGFVSLMSVNDYCKEYFIDFSDIDLSCDEVLISKDWNNQDKCKCRNYMFITENADIIEFYSRYYANGNNNLSSLVYDINCLKDGFNRKIIL